MILSRRFFLGGLLAAPAVVAVTNIMPVRSIARLILPPPLVTGPYVTFADAMGKVFATLPVEVIKTIDPDGSVRWNIGECSWLASHTAVISRVTVFLPDLCPEGMLINSPAGHMVTGDTLQLTSFPMKLT